MNIAQFIDNKIREKFRGEAVEKAQKLAWAEVAKWFEENLNEVSVLALTDEFEKAGGDEAKLEKIMIKFLAGIPYGKMRLLDRLDYYLTALHYK